MLYRSHGSEFRCGSAIVDTEAKSPCRRRNDEKIAENESIKLNMRQFGSTIQPNRVSTVRCPGKARISGRGSLQEQC